jgi:hypothetical protein
MATSTAGRAEAGGWAVGFAWFAASMLMLIGTFQFLEGLAAVIENEFFVVGANYVYEFDVTAWGWIHMIVGVVVAFAGWGVFSGQTWARAVGITVAVISAIAQFLYIPYYPVWAVLIIALCVACIWALATYGRDDADEFRRA